jgi:ribosomal protein S18 acetylase RimI-like enzyme
MKPTVDYSIREMTLADYDDVFRLWSDAPGIILGDDDTPDRIELYLKRNQGLCFVAVAAGRVVGTVLCGHEGRRGILRHLTTERALRGMGIGRALTQRCLTALSQQGIRKCNLYVMDANPEGMGFWKRLGFLQLDDDFRTLQHPTQVGLCSSALNSKPGVPDKLPPCD